MTVREDNGRFSPGHTGNPGGRPHGSRTFAGRLAHHTFQVDPETGEDNLDDIINNLLSLAKRGSRVGIMAAQLVAAYLDGRPGYYDPVARPGGAGSGQGVVLLLPSNGRELPLVEAGEIMQAEVVDGRVVLAFPDIDVPEGEVP